MQPQVPGPPGYPVPGGERQPQVPQAGQYGPPGAPGTFIPQPFRPATAPPPFPPSAAPPFRPGPPPGAPPLMPPGPPSNPTPPPPSYPTAPPGTFPSHPPPPNPHTTFPTYPTPPPPTTTPSNMPYNTPPSAYPNQPQPPPPNPTPPTGFGPTTGPGPAPMSYPGSYPGRPQLGVPGGAMPYRPGAPMAAPPTFGAPPPPPTGGGLGGAPPPGGGPGYGGGGAGMGGHQPPMGMPQGPPMGGGGQGPPPGAGGGQYGTGYSPYSYPGVPMGATASGAVGVGGGVGGAGAGYGGYPYPGVAMGAGGGGGGGPGADMGGGAQALVEDFASLSMTPHPGSLSEAVDVNALPRPLDVVDPAPAFVAPNAPLRYVRFTCGVMPNSASLRGRWHLPLGAVIHPLAPSEEPVPVVSFGPSGIVRCRRCRTYVNPYVTFTDNGRRWRCNVCGFLNEVPVDYFCPLDASGRRTDIAERPELREGSVEFLAPAEYMVRAPMPPVYFFVIDVSQAASASGALGVIVDTIKSCLDKLPGDNRTRIGFLTFDSSLHFYNLKASLSQPQMLVVGELDEPFLPLPDDLLVNLSEARDVVDALLDSLTAMHANSSNVESCLGPALRAAGMVMGQLGGKLLLFSAALPSLGVGRLRLRGDDPRVYGTEREGALRVAEDNFYKNTAAEFSRLQISVNVYVLAPGGPGQFMDVATLGTLAKYTAGQVYHFPGFSAGVDGERLRQDLARDLTRETAWEAVMRIRAGKGLRISSFHGHFFIRSTDLLALPAIDADKAVAVQIQHEDTLVTSSTVFLQCALLYTSSSGERRIRVHTVAVPVVAGLAEMYRAADVGATVTLLGKLALERSTTARLEEARTFVQHKCILALREYRSLHAAQRTTGRLVFPESMALLPLLCLGLVKSTALRGGFQEVGADERSAAIYEMMNMSCTRTLALLYPRLLRLDDMAAECGQRRKDGSVALPPALPLSVERLDPRGAFLLHDGMRALLWLGNVLAPDFAQQVLGREGASADLSKVVVSEQPTGLSLRVRTLLEALQEQAGGALFPTCLVVRQGDPREQMLISSLVEDRATGGQSYLDWIITVHRQVQQKS